MDNLNEKAALSVAAASQYLDVSRPTLYRLMNAGALSSFHIGRRRLLLKAALDRFLRERVAEAEAGR